MPKCVLMFVVSLLCSTGFAQAHQVTFQVDLSQEAAIASTVSVAGNFQEAAGYATDWTPGITVLTDPDGDDVYTLTVNLPTDAYEYLFINGTAWGDEEVVPGECAVNGNRHMVINQDTTLDVVCFGECSPCVPPPVNVSVTLQVDLQNEVVTEMVSVAGSFQGEVVGESWVDWTPGQAVLQDPDADQVYTITFVVPEAVYEFKYLNGDEWGEDETVPPECWLNGNRELNVVGPGPMVVPVHCYSSCDPCESGAGVCGDPVPITCGETILSSDSTSFSNNIDVYSCSGWNESGPEIVYGFSLDNPNTDVTATISNPSVDLDVFLVDPAGCASGLCITADSYGDTEAVATGLGPGTYNIVVDGFNGGSGTFDLRLGCVVEAGIFADWFESGDTSGWSSALP